MPEMSVPPPAEPRPENAEELNGLPRPQPPLSWSERVAALGDALGVDLTPARLAVTLLLVAGIVAAGYALLRPPMVAPAEQSLPYADRETPVDGEVSPTASTIPVEVVVHAAGAVASPGLYRVPAGSRIADVVAAAGGAASDADLNRVNLAALVEDGQQVYVPRVGEPAPSGGGGADGTGDGAPVDLNTASPEELDALPGIGPATAQAIITYREEHGAFGSVDELLEVPGIGDAKLAQLRDLVTT